MRRFLADSIGSGVPQETKDDVLLIASELVANAVVHVDRAIEGPIEVSVTSDDQSLRVTITDPGPGFDRGGLAPPGDEGGWGLALVDRLASRWGVVRSTAGTEASFEVDWS